MGVYIYSVCVCRGRYECAWMRGGAYMCGGVCLGLHVGVLQLISHPLPFALGSSNVVTIFVLIVLRS